MKKQNLNEGNPHEEGKKVMGGSFAVSLLIHGLLLLLLGSIIIVPGVVKEMTRITAVAPPQMEVPPAPPMVQPSDVTQDSPGGSPISDVPENATPSSTEDSVDALTLSSPVNTGPSLNAMPGATAVSVDAFTSGRGGSGGGTGYGVGKGTGKGMTFFGSREKTADSMVGRFYDLQQFSNRQPSTMRPTMELQTACVNMGRAVQEFVSSGYSPTKLARYFSSHESLYASYIFMPSMRAIEAPRAYGVEKEVQQPCIHWVAHYQALVAPPADGIYRFVGFADEYLLVGVDGKTVLDGSTLSIDITCPEVKYSEPGVDFRPMVGSHWIPPAPHPYPRPRGSYESTLVLMPGNWIEWKANEFKRLDILIGDSRGRGFSGYLFLEEQGKNYAKDANGVPILPVFRVANTELTLKEFNPNSYPEFTYGPVFKAKHIQ